MTVEGSANSGKSAGAMLAIGEVAARVGVPTHILRYWETRFPQLRPLQRSGRRRYYRAEDVALVERIHQLLNREGFTVEGARKALAGNSIAVDEGAAREPSPRLSVRSLMDLRERLARALQS
jgi:DNA-binding transcriptional MerR regulator